MQQNAEHKASSGKEKRGAEVHADACVCVCGWVWVGVGVWCVVCAGVYAAECA